MSEAPMYAANLGPTENLDVCVAALDQNQAGCKNSAQATTGATRMSAGPSFSWPIARYARWAIVVAIAGLATAAPRALAEPFVYVNGGWIYYSDGTSAPQAITIGAGTPGLPPENPALSPDGRRIAYNDGCSGSSCGSSNWGTIYITTTDGGRGQAIVPQYGQFQSDVSFSSDGRRIVFTRTSDANSWDIWTADINGANQRLIIGWANAQIRPDLSPDGSKLTFSSYSSQSGTTYTDGSKHVFVTDANGLGAKDLGIGWNPSFSPDGTRVAFERSGQLYVVDVTGANLRQVTKGKASVSEPDWGNGQRIIYQRSGGTTIAAINADGSGSTTLEIGTAPSLQQTSRMTDSDWLSVFSPQLRYDSLEDYYADAPSVITDMYQTSPPSTPERAGSNRLVDSAQNTIADSAPPTLAGSPPQLTLGFLNSGTYANGALASASDSIDLRGSSESDYIPDSQYMHNQSIYGNKVYARKAVDGGMTWLQYWFFYYYDVVPGALQIGDHEGDWEMVQVGLDAQNIPRVVTFAAHGDSEAITCPWNEIEKTVAGGDYVPIAYIAHGTHAPYPHAGTWPRSDPLPDDNVDGAVAIRPTMVAGVLDPGVGWVKWPGSWGNSHALGPLEQSSPRGPMYQGPKWSSPATFNNQARPCSSISRSTATGRTRQAPAPRPIVNYAVPAVKAHATRQGRRHMRVVYRVLSRPARRADRAVSLLVSADGKGTQYQPRTYTYALRRMHGVVRQSLPLGSGPYTVRVVALTARMAAAARSHDSSSAEAIGVGPSAW